VSFRAGFPTPQTGVVNGAREGRVYRHGWHREFAQLAVVEDGLVRAEGWIGVTPEALRQWAAGLRADDQVALGATGSSDVIENLLMPLSASGSE
jgi:hypothetical protein